MNTRLQAFRRNSFAALSLMLCTATLPQWAFAQGAADIEQDGDSISLNFRDADLQQLVDVVSRATGKVFILDRNVQGQVTVVSGGELAPEQLYDVFLSILDVNGFSAVPSGPITKIVRKDLVRSATTPTVFDKEQRSADEQITRVFTLEHSSPAEVAPVIQPLLPPTSVLQVHVPTNSMIVSDSAGNIERIERIIERLDRPSVTGDVVVVRLKHATATKLGPIVSGIISGQAAQGNSPNQKRLIVQPDTSLNALVLTGTGEQISLAQALISELDVAPLTGELGTIRVFRLKYSKASDILPILEAIISGRKAAQPQSQTIDPATGQVVAYNPNGNSNSSSGLNADEATNSIIVRGTPELFADIEAIISYLDVRRPQVLVEAVIAEVTENKQSQLGVSWQGVNNRFDNGELDGSFGSTTENFSGMSVGFISQRIFSLNQQGLVPDLRLVVEALRSDSESNIVATPNIMTLNNNEAEIVVGQEIPVITSRTEDDNNSNNETKIEVERKTVGMKLKIKPQINEGNSIILEIEQEISSVVPSIEAEVVDVVTSERTIKTTVEAQNGQVIVLGGLVQDNATGTNSHVPGLGNIPIFGNLFKSRSKSGEKTNLMVFIRPVIVDQPGVISKLTSQRYDHVRQSQMDSLQDLRYMLPNHQPSILPELEEYQTGTRLPLQFNEREQR